jgi:hypothetical protein
VAWFVATAVLFTVGMYGVAETLASGCRRRGMASRGSGEASLVPGRSLFPISALPAFLAWFARCLPLTHGLALMRYGSSVTAWAWRTSGARTTRRSWRDEPRGDRGLRRGHDHHLDQGFTRSALR